MAGIPRRTFEHTGRHCRTPATLTALLHLLLPHPLNKYYKFSSMFYIYFNVIAIIK